ncbi:hypothetical protein OH77DRAFT_1438263 [Trametes cingulata]|nr:hypothetical protein OH77DRAFT_1438263 [Trametes cingulata]
MADAESSITDSSLAPSTTPTSLLDSVVPVLSSSDRTEKAERRASLGLIDAARVRFSKDFHSLLRSSSKSQRARTVLSTQAEDPESEHLVYSNYVKLSPHAVDLEVQSMDDSAAAVEERPGRGFGARIANFLNRSRSRSRSKKRRSRSLDALPAVDPMPTTLHTASLRLHARHSSLEPDVDAAAAVAGPSRPITRSPSRPLSGVAAPANASSSKSRSTRRGPDPLAIPSKSGPTATAELVAQLLPMEPTKSTSSKKGKSFNIFGMLLSSPRKSSFGEPARGRSRPSTPSPAVPAAPDPMWQGSEEHTWATKSGSQRSHRSTRKDVPVHPDEDANDQCLTSCISTDHHNHGKSSALPGLVSPQPRRAPIHVLNSPPPMPRGGYLKPEAMAQSQSRDSDASMLEGRCSPLCGLGGSSKGSHTSHSQEKGKEKEKERMRGARDRSREREREKERTADRREKEREKARERRREHDREMREKEKERDRELLHVITHPRRVGSPLPPRDRDRDRPRESTSAVAVSAVPLEKTTSNRSAGSKHSASKDHHQGHPRSGADGAAARAKRIKHGSFDFERPVSSGVAVGGGYVGVSVRSALRTMGVGGSAAPPHPLQRSLSARGVPSRRPDESLDAGFAPSSLPNTRPILDKGKKKPTADVHFAEPPSRRATDNSQSSSTHHHHHQQSSSTNRGGLTVPSHHRDAGPSSPISSHSGSSSQHGRDGSWGRNGAKRMARASHGPFKFEPAVPPIPATACNSNDARRCPTGVTTVRVWGLEIEAGQGGGQGSVARPWARADVGAVEGAGGGGIEGRPEADGYECQYVCCAVDIKVERGG